MKHLYLNLKRFDIPVELGGVNRLSSVEHWGGRIVEETQEELKRYDRSGAEFVQFFPEAHLLNALAARCEDSPVQIGCQGIYRMNTSKEGNFGAFTTQRPANSMKAMGCMYTIIGHCEERKDKEGIIREAGKSDRSAVNRILNQEIRQAVEAGMKVLYCVGENSEEQPCWKDVLKEQLEVGLEGVDKAQVVIAYEPLWSIGPGKKPADKAYITKAARAVKEITGGCDVVYGGGLKEENAKMLSEIEEIDGGLIALTRFQGDIGFYPSEYLRIISLYMS